MASKEQLSKSRNAVRHYLAEFPEMIMDEPQAWWKKTARLIIGYENQIQAIPDKKMRLFLETEIKDLQERLRAASRLNPVDSAELITEADHLIMDFSMDQAHPFERKDIYIQTHFLPLETIIFQQPDKFRQEEEIVNGVDCLVLYIKLPLQEGEEKIPLPKNQALWHKGGGARLVADIVFQAPISMQESEIPLHDYDVLLGNRCDKKVAMAIGVEADGVELMGEDSLNFSRYCAGRDTTQNQLLLGAEGLYYSEAAKKAAVSGHTKIENEYVANKAIYGFDKRLSAARNWPNPGD